tara:strand:+ start:927 stop:1388 length:462 start_codon:yes stop_codon:yes gene_type:complete
MPLYEYQCKECDESKEVFVSFEFRKEPQRCDCIPQGGIANYVFPTGAINGFMPFESYYDESLNMDIHGIRHKQQTLRALNLVEAGDRKGGALNWDENAPDIVQPTSRLSGRSLDDKRREDDKRSEDADNFAVGTVGEDGEIDDYKRASDLPNG